MTAEGAISRDIRRRLPAPASRMAVQGVLRPRGWAPGVLAVGLIGAPAVAVAQETIDLGAAAELVMQGGAAFDQSGTSVSGAGDVNGDGIDDLIIGAPLASSGAGASYVIFGTDRGFPAAIDLAKADVVIQGAAPGDQAGISVSTLGDVDGDGIDDLMIGAWNADPNGRDDAGASYLILGSDQGLPATIELATEADVVIQGAAAFDYSGYSVSGAGDVNGDGFDDLVIGAWNSALQGREHAGTSYVVFGTDQGFPATIDLAEGADLIIQGAAFDDRAGYSVSGAGDVDGDGIGDLIIGAHHAYANGRAVAGASYVVFGAEDLSGTIDLADPVNGADLIVQGAGSFNLSGGSVSGAGDVNGDGFDDLVIGADSASPNGRDVTGASYVILGSDRGLPATIDLATDSDVVIHGAAAGDGAGFAVSGAGDLNGDGFDDLIIGSHASPDGNEEASTSYVILGNDHGLPANIDLADGADLILQGGVAFGGRSVSGAGDVNGDGFDDMIIGAPYADPNGRDDAGASYVVFGGPAAALERLIVPVEAADLERETETILTKTLTRVRDDITKRRVHFAIVTLGVFVREVAALRGNMIDAADADDWIADAEAIIDMLKAQRRRQREPGDPINVSTGATP